MTGPGIYSQVYHRTPCPAVPVSRSHHNGQLENALQKHCFVYSALIVGTLKGSTDFLISVPKVKILQSFEWTRFPLIFPYGQKSMSTKRADKQLI